MRNGHSREKNYLEIGLPDKRLEAIERRAHERGYQNLEYYVLDLIQKDLRPVGAKRQIQS